MAGGQGRGLGGREAPCCCWARWDAAATRQEWEGEKKNTVPLSTQAPSPPICRQAGLSSAKQSFKPPPSADKQVFPGQDVVGWYATGANLGTHDMDIHRKVG